MVLNMDSNEKEMLVQNGFDVDGAMHRFLNNEALYKKCMRKYLDDTSFDALKEAYEEENVNDAFKAAHTMKGFVSNLGIDCLYHILIPMVDKLRVQDINIGDELKELEELYKRTYEIIEKM